MNVGGKASKGTPPDGRLSENKSGSGSKPAASKPSGYGSKSGGKGK